MKKVFAPLLVALASTLAVYSHATTNPTTKSNVSADRFVVKFYDVSGLKDLPIASQNKIKAILARYTDKHMTVNRLLEARNEIQEILENDLKGGFSVNIPPQTIRKYTVKFNILNVKGEVNYITGSKHFDAENAKRSIPSVANGLSLANGYSNLDVRELALAQENPAKVTGIRYLISGVKPVKLEVMTNSQSGKYLNNVTIDNFGAESTRYGRFSYSFVNANLTNRDDVLYLYLLSNFFKAKNYYAFAVRYSYPFYSIRTKLEILAMKSHIDTTHNQLENLPIDIKGKGGVFELSLRQITKAFDVSSPMQNTVSAAYNIQALASSQSTPGIGSLGSSKYKLATLILTNNFTYKPNEKYTLNVITKANWVRSGAFGTTNFSTLQALRSGASPDQIWLNLDVTSNYRFNNSSLFKISYHGQYTNSSLVSSFQKGIGGLYGVTARGFRSAAATDKVHIFNLQYELPTYVQPTQVGNTVTPYVFYDVGFGKNNLSPLDNSSTKESYKASSIGLGVKGSIRNNLRYNVSLARKLWAAKQDNSNVKIDKIYPSGGIFFTLNYLF